MTNVILKFMRNLLAEHFFFCLKSEQMSIVTTNTNFREIENIIYQQVFCF